MRLSLTLISSLASMVMLSACSDDKPVKQVEQVRPVKLFNIESASYDDGRLFPAKIKAQGQADMAFRLGGELVKLPVLQGQEVTKGELVAQLDDRDAKNLLLLREADYELAQADFARKQQLLEQKLISQALYDDAKAKLKVARASLATAKDQLSYTKLLAPFDGVVAKRLVDNYQTVQPTQIILSLQRNDSLDVIIQVPEALVLQTDKKEVTEQLAASVRFAIDDNKFYPVSFKEFSTQVNANTQSYEATFSLAQPKDIEVLPGMSAELKLIHKEEQGLGIAIIPMAAVSMDDASGLSRVWLYDDKTQLVSSRVVELGQLRSDGIEVISGLSRNDVIVAAGVIHLKEGMKVKPLVWQRGL